MQINLKQSEIEVALKNYVAHQGISLYARDVSITFTAGRKESGISAEISIEDADIPGFSDSFLMDPVIPAHLLKSQSTEVELVQPTVVASDSAVEEADTEVVAVVEAAPVTVAEEIATEAVIEVPAKPASLFG